MTMQRLKRHSAASVSEWRNLLAAANISGGSTPATGRFLHSLTLVAE